MEFYSLCPTRFEPNGHGAIYHLSFAKAIQKIGYSHSAFLTDDSQAPNSKWLHHFEKKRFTEFSNIFLKKRTQKRIFFIESFTTKDLIAMTCAAHFFLRKTDRLWILLRQGLPQLPLNGKTHLLLLKSLKNKALFLTDSERVAENFAPYLKLNVLPIPHINVEPTDKMLRPPYICWWPGQPRPAKGLKDIQRLSQHENPNFQLMISEKTPMLIPSAPNTTFLPPTLSQEQYRKYLKQSDIVLLPYDPKAYKFGTSGIFVEAVSAGKIPLVKEGSWLAEELKAFGLKELVVDWEDPQFFTHAQSLIESKETREKLSKMQAHYLQFHSIDNCAQKIQTLMSHRN